MNALKLSKIARLDAPGEIRAAALNEAGQACQLFLERWSGVGAPARAGTVHDARLRAFTDTIGGAFLELDSGEETFLRLKTRGQLTEGAHLTVQIASEARADKLARVIQADAEATPVEAWAAWCAQFADDETLPIEHDADRVEAAFDEALSASVTLPGGGQLHIDRTRALTAIDIDTSGRVQKGSAGARALSLNLGAVREAARQVQLRGLGGNLVLDCIDPVNKAAGEKIQAAAIQAFENLGYSGVKVLRPSPLGLLEMSVPWREAPLADRLGANPGETELLDLFRTAQRDAKANPTGLYRLALSKSARHAYLDRRSEADTALNEAFGGRVSVSDTEAEASKVEKR